MSMIRVQQIHLISPSIPWQLTEAVSDVAVQALAAIDLSTHLATHPRLGSVDHISCHPIGQDATIQEAAALAHHIGAQLSTGTASLPVYYYGAASKQGHSLAHIRRQLGEKAGLNRMTVFVFARPKGGFGNRS